MIALVNPNIALVYEKYRHTGYQFPLGLAYVASTLEQGGFEVRIIDADSENLTPNETAMRILETECELVGFTCSTPLYSQVKTISTFVKNQNAKIVTIVGGPHITALGCQIHEPCIDYKFMGEVEGHLPRVLNRHKAAGGTFECDKAIDINECPLPARHLFSYDGFFDARLRKKTTTIITSRGCVGKCKYCFAGKQTGIRFRNIENIAKELEQIVKGFGIQSINIEDDNFMFNKKRTVELCEVLGQFNIEYSAMAIARFVDEETLKVLSQSGCKWLCYGIESGNDEILKDMGRLSTTNDVRRAFETTKKYGIRIRGAYMLGWIDETEELMRQTLDFIKELKADENAVSIVTPFPGTELWDFVMKDRDIDEINFDNFCYYNKIAFNLSAVPNDTLLKMQEEAFKIIREYKS